MNNITRRHLLTLSVIVLTLSCNSYANSDLNELKNHYKRPSEIPFPANNPYSPQKAMLGKMLFFDARLSRDQNFTCATCHSPSFGWEVPLAKAVGAGGKPLGRSAPTVQNHAWTKLLFWDGRAAGLEAQARGPIESPVEMDLPMSTAVARLKKVSAYQKAFNEAFPNEGITESNILKSIATYERTLVSNKSAFDEWVDGNEKAISESAKNGFLLFNGKARCVSCHVGWNFSDDRFHDIGLITDDLGRFGVTKNPNEMHAMKTPSLRDAVQRAPYMHNGSVGTLEDVVIHYVSGGIKRPSLSPLMQPLNLSKEEIKSLVDFMKSTTSKNAATVLPNIPAQ